MINDCIVLADKHQHVLGGLRSLLETLFGGVVMVADQPSLLEAINKIKPKVAIVELSLLREGEIIVASRLHDLYPEVKIIVISDYCEPEIVQEIMSAGVLGFVSKQHAGTDLLEAITNIQNGEIFISPVLKKD